MNGIILTSKQALELLFLGDSFTKGTGSEPWLDDLASNYNKFGQN